MGGTYSQTGGSIISDTSVTEKQRGQDDDGTQHFRRIHVICMKVCVIVFALIISILQSIQLTSRNNRAT
jgi:hypothetical protein